MPKKKRPKLDIPTVKVGPGILLEYVFKIKPIPKGRPRAQVTKTKSGKTKIFAYTPERTKQYEYLIEEATDLQHTLDGALECDIDVTMAFFLSDRRHGDIDNLAKAILDGMQGVAFKDDRQVKGLYLDIFFKSECGEPSRFEEKTVVTITQRGRRATMEYDDHGNDGENSQRVWPTTECPGF